jgi:hypothetical protein
MKSLRLIPLLLGAVLAIASSDALPTPSSDSASPVAADLTVPVRFLVDVIPAEAKYVIYGQINLKGLVLSEANSAEVGNKLTNTCPGFVALARQRGANLVVFLSNETGIEIHVKPLDRPLILRAHDPVVTAILFQWAAAGKVDEKERSIRFTTTVPDHPTPSISYKIELKTDTAGITKSFWLYGNISRFVKDAVTHGFDTVAIRSSEDTATEDVWLPGCDEPLKVSLGHPVLDVLIFTRKPPNPAAELTRPTVTPPADAGDRASGAHGSP